jgi:predicted RNase H-like HicB family nuclease
MPRKKVDAVKRGHYRVVFERDENGAWIARVPSIRGCHTHGRTLDQARRRIREALALWVDDAETAELDEDVRLPGRARVAIERSRRARREAEQTGARAREATTQAARTLVNEAHLGLRDAGELLDLSHQRVQQLVRGALKGRLAPTSELRAQARKDEAAAEARR